MLCLSNKKIVALVLAAAFSQVAMADATPDDKSTNAAAQATFKAIGNGEAVLDSNQVDGSSKKTANNNKYPPKNDIFDVKPSRSPFLDTKQAVFQYDPNESYPVITRAGQNTYIDLPEGVTVSGFYLSNPDDENWIFHVTPDKKQISIQPVKSGNFDSASIVTNKFKFLLAITSTDEGQWFQNVKWTVPKKYLADAKNASADSNKAGSSSGKYYESYIDIQSPAHQDVVKGIDVDSLNTKWKIEGDAPFKPVEVYNDKDSTYILMPPNLAEFPALFAINAEGDSELVNYTSTAGGRYKVTKVLQGGLLKIGKQEVRITNLVSSKSRATSSQKSMASSILGGN